MVESMVSTVITSYNKGPYLAEAVNSALLQDYCPHEVLVINDGSTDETQEVAAAFGDRIRYLSQPNRGQANARNWGIRESRGEYIAFLDGDDRWRSGKLSKQMGLFVARPTLGLVYTDRLKFSGDTIVWSSNRCGHELRRGRVLDWLLSDMFIPFSSVLVRRECLIEAGLFDESVRVADDYDLWLRFTRLYEIDFIDEVLVEYRLGIDSIGSRVGSKVHHTLATQRRFIDRYYGGTYSNRRAATRAYASKHSAHGDFLLAQSKHRLALGAYLRALTQEWYSWRRYYAVARALLPNRIARRARAILSKS